jgi:hypothetical protein
MLSSGDLSGLASEAPFAGWTASSDPVGGRGDA